MIFPTLLREARELGVSLPYPRFRHYESERAKKLSILLAQRLFEIRTSALFSLEAFAGELDVPPRRSTHRPWSFEAR
jgi:hypothetical protein